MPGDRPGPELRRALDGLREALGSIGHPRAAEVSAALALAERDPEAFWRAIDGNDWWAGAGSLAAETLADNPGLPNPDWQDRVRGLRAHLIEIGEALIARGRHNPGIPSWVLAFRNWNQSQV
ncbi:MAG: hypothetical protein ACM3ST_13650 [Bdellovibrio bacteriovorus]